MLFPTFEEVTRYREMTTTFGGYNHQLSCQEGQFYDMKNMTSQYFPILSPRQNRGIVKQFAMPQGILDKEDLMWIDDGKLYLNGEEKTLNGVTISSEGKKTLAKMGAYVIIMPDKIWYNVDKNECGYMEHKNIIASGNQISFTLCEANGKAISFLAEGHAPSDGDYTLSTTNGKTSLKIYSSTTKTWITVATTYIQISATGIGKGLEKGDGVKIIVDKIGEIDRKLDAQAKDRCIFHKTLVGAKGI
jgi:hypothetical protein